MNVIQAAMQRGLNTQAAQALRQKAEVAVQSEHASGSSGEFDLTAQLQPKSGQFPKESLPQTEYLQLATLFNAGRYAELENSARLLIEQYPESGFAQKFFGVSLMVQGKEALSALQKAAELLPDDAEAHSNLGNALTYLGQIDGAAASYRRALEIKPDFAEAYYNLGNALKELGQLDGAVASYRRALEIKPDFVEAHYNLGNAWRDIGQLDNAVASYRRVLEIKPDFSDARMNLGCALNSNVGKNSGNAFLDENTQGFQGVRRQYENLPFPSRDPEAERYMLLVSIPDILGKINQYCFCGSRDYSKPFRVLVAGCGTGDSVIWLAYQLKDTPAEIVAIDMSEASLEVAQSRAKVRNLTNIKWINGSLLDISIFGLGKFDYITCLGVLHHLPDPVAGLIALESVLAEGGAMAIMLYGAIGRSHIYAMQNILRKSAIGLDDPRDRLAFAKKVLTSLPAKNEFRMREGQDAINKYLRNDANFWDTLLHEQDRAYTASEVRGFLASAGLLLQTFISYKGVGAITNLQYELDLYVDDVSQKERLEKTLSLAERQDLAEALDGSLALHTVYATRSLQPSLSPTLPSTILSPMSHYAQQIIASLGEFDQGLPIILSNGRTLSYKPSVVTQAFLKNIDGYRSNAEIIRLLGIREGSDELILLNKELRIPAALHWVIARTSVGSYLQPIADRSNLSFPLRHHEPMILSL